MQDEGEILKKERGIDMPVRVHNFLGRLGWNARKYFPVLASESYLKLQFVTRRKLQKNYIE